MINSKKKLKRIKKPEIELNYFEDSTSAQTIIPEVPIYIRQSPIFRLKEESTKFLLPSPAILTANHSPHSRKYSMGSVYRQASRLVQCVSSSTNISSSISGSVEVLISEIDNPYENSSPQGNSLSPLREELEEQTEDEEERVIQNIISMHRSLNNSRYSYDEDLLNNSMRKIQNAILHDKIDRDAKNLEVRLMVLKSFNTRIASCGRLE